MYLAVCFSSFVALVLYLNTLDANFAYDDSRAIQKNQDLLPETPITNIFYDDFWGTPMTHSGSHKSYRPLCVLTFRLNYYFGELNPWGYHLGNVILHTLVTAVFTYFAGLFLKQTFATLVSGLIFASHPIHTEAVTGVVGRADVGACLFFILSLLSYVKYVHIRDTSHDPGGSRSKRFLYFLLTAIFTTASLLTKEQGVTVLAVCITYDLFVHNKMKVTQVLQFYKESKSRQTMEGMFLLSLLGMCLVGFRVYFMGNKPPEFAPSDNPASDSNVFLTRGLTYFLLPSLNFWMLLCPRILSFDWSMQAIPLVESLSDHRNLFTISFYTILGYIAYYVLKYIHHSSKDYLIKPFMNGNGYSNFTSSKHSTNKHKSFQRQNSSHHSDAQTEISDNSPHSVDILILSIAIIVFPFIPATNLFFYVGFVIAERVLYIPSMGFCLLVGHGTYVLYRRYQNDTAWKRKVVVMALVSLLMLNGLKTVSRNRDWSTEENLYRSGVAVNPAKAWGNLANIFNTQGKKMEAEEAYRNALKQRGNMADVHYNLGILLQDQKRYDEAVESYKNAISFRPKLSVAHLNLGILQADLGHKQEAERIYRHCADLDTSGLKDPRLHDNAKISCLYNLGRLLNENGRSEEAVGVFQTALERKPDHYPAHSLYNMYGEVWSTLNKYDEAEHWYKEALKAKPDHIPAHLTLAKLYAKKGQTKEAESWFLKAKSLDEHDTSTGLHYAQFLTETGRLMEAADMYQKYVSESPENFELVFNAANTLRQIQKNEDAEKLFIKASKLKPNEATAHMNLGAMFHVNGKLKDAEKSYLRALELKPNDNTTKKNLAKLRNLMNEKKGAL